MVNTGNIETNGSASHGIFAQSVGGGGGNGGLAVAASIDTSTLSDALLEAGLMSIGIGGFGGNGANSGSVVVDHSGSIVIRGDNSFGIFAQSVSGGGGTAGLSISSPVWMAVDYGIPALLGGKDGSNGTAGNVTINTTGTIITLGVNSAAHFSQSVNGGGGDLQLYMDISKDASDLGEGSVIPPEKLSEIEKITEKVKSAIGLGEDGGNNNPGGHVKDLHSGDVMTTGDNSAGMEAQSIGGGGGNGSVTMLVRQQADIDLELNLGAQSANQNSGGNIDLVRTGQLMTSGNGSQGMLVQSIGGGGGNLVINIERVAESEGSINKAREVLSENAQAAAASTKSSTSLTLGGNGGVTNDAGVVKLDMKGDLQTTAAGAQGLLVQSIGAGGGQVHLSGTDSVNVLLGGQNGAMGNGGDIVIINRGLISTFGARAQGVFLRASAVAVVRCSLIFRRSLSC